MDPMTTVSTGRKALASSTEGASFVKAVIIAGKIGSQMAKQRMRKLPEANSGIE
jgi:hypothetical protein